MFYEKNILLIGLRTINCESIYIERKYKDTKGEIVLFISTYINEAEKNVK